MPIFYNVYDTEAGEDIMTNVSSKAISDRTGVQKYKVSEYAKRHLHYKGKYYFTKTRETVTDTIRGTDLPIMKEFDEAMEALKKNYTPDQLRRIVLIQKEERQAG